MCVPAHAVEHVSARESAALIARLVLHHANGTLCVVPGEYVRWNFNVGEIGLLVYLRCAGSVSVISTITRFYVYLRALRASVRISLHSCGIRRRL